MVSNSLLTALILLAGSIAKAESTSSAMHCSSSSYRLARCAISDRKEILRVDLTQQVSRASCQGNWSYTSSSRQIAVWSGCRANFKVTFKDAPVPVVVKPVPSPKITDPALPVDYKRNAPLESAITRSLRSSSLSAEQLAQHALDRLGFGAGGQPSIRGLIRLTNGEVDEAKTHAAILRYVMHSLADVSYQRKDVEKLLARDFPNSSQNYAEVTETSRRLLDPIRQLDVEMKRLLGIAKRSAKEEADLQSARLERQSAGQIYNQYRYTLWEASQARMIANAVASNYGLKTKLVYLWFNRLNVNAEKVNFEFTDYVRMIASHTHGQFDDMLLASARHPAMLMYLNNYLNRVDDKKGVRPNEDYGRELMELHSLGIPAGTTSGPNSYTLEDVRAASRILAGWTIASPPNGPRQFAFVPRFNPTGGKSLLGTSFADGEAGGIDFIQFLAKHPLTALSISKMLVNYFVSEDLSSDDTKALVKDLQASFLASGGDLSGVYEEMVSHPSFWSNSAFRSKVNDPFQQVVKTLKVAGYTAETLTRSVLLRNDREVASATPKGSVPWVPGAAYTAAAMGLDLFKCVPPTGYSIRSNRWMSANNVVGMIRFAYQQADFNAPASRQTQVDKMERLAGEMIERGSFEAAKSYVRSAIFHGYGGIWSAERFGYPAAKGEIALTNALTVPDKFKTRPAYVRTAAGLFFGSLENSVQ